MAAHASVLGGGLVWLDHAHLEQRLALRRPGEWLALFREPFAGTGYYRPLTALSLSIDALAQRTAVYHAVNLALHALTAALLSRAARALGSSRRAATLGALLFAVHPLGSLVAGAIAFRSEALVACGLLGLVIAHRERRPLAAALALLVAALSKETGLALAPLFVVALELGRRAGGRVLGAEAASLLAALGLRLAFAPAWRARFPQLDAAEAVGTRLAALAKSAAALVLPLDRGLCDAFPITSPGDPQALVGALVAMGLVALAWSRRELGLLAAVATLPSLQLVATLRWWSPHYLYLPAALLLVLAAERFERWGPRAFGLALLAGVGLAVLAWRDGRRYLSDETLWGPEVRREPACREGQFYLAESARARGDLALATRRYEEALRSRPGVLAFLDLEATLTNYGLVLFRQRRLDEAARAFDAALEHTTEELARRKLRHDRAAVDLARGDVTAALRRLEPEVARADALPESLLVYAAALEAAGRGAEAAAVRRRLHAP